MNSEKLRDFIRDVPDFPKKGIVFKDITTLLKDPQAFRHAIDTLAARYKGKGIDVVASVESRGFIFGAVLAHQLGTGFVPLRKPGKLPWKKVRMDYELEYGTDAIEIHEDAVKKGDKVLLVDDLLATGGTIKAAAGLVEKLGGRVVGMAFLIELDYLKGREKLKGYEIYSLINYGKE
ncbi:MAG: adenine phosphoribosyltransferase [Candidatus Micrarchaeota archaeon]|nr:adenine phosphoribosyltransferase [Candidatus Micrarchaeota archaeon]